MNEMIKRELQHHAKYGLAKEPLCAATPNLVAGIIGDITREVAANKNCGDSIDRGLILIRRLNEVGLSLTLKNDHDR